MKAAFTMWRYTRMIILVAVCAAIYSAALIAFKTAIPIIPGITEVRVGNIFPMPFGIMFGPAGAWGAAIGNLVGDVFGGTLSPASIAGFFGNFLLGYLPYTLWKTILPFGSSSRAWDPGRFDNWARYLFIGFISSAACAVLISISVDAIGMVPYQVLSKIITLNDTIGSWIGAVLLSTVFPTIKDHLNLFWEDVMEEGDIGIPVAGAAGAWIIVLASIGGLVGSFFTSLPVSAIGWFSSVFIVIGCILL